MPTYEYQCKSCKYVFDELQTMSDAPLTECPSCHEQTLERLISTGTGMIFKGSGFYLTDYKNGSSPASTGSSSSSSKKESSASSNTGADKPSPKKES